MQVYKLICELCKLPADAEIFLTIPRNGINETPEELGDYVYFDPEIEEPNTDAPFYSMYLGKEVSS